MRLTNHPPRRLVSLMPTQFAKGFTLMEMLAAVGIAGLLLLYMASQMGWALGSEQRQNAAVSALNNRQIVEGLKVYAAGKYARGVLPNPYSGNGYVATIYNSGDTSASGVALAQSLTSAGVPPTQINDDGSAGANVRVYQLITGLPYVTPMELQSGPQVNLVYQYGVIYQTACRKADSSCNPSASTGIPGDSPKLTTSNYATYQIAGNDTNLVTVSSLPVQLSMLLTTRTNLNDLQDALMRDFKARQINAAAGDATNFYPAASTSMAGQNPTAASSQGCRDGWYSLSTSDLLAQVQTSSTQYGTTAWGGDVQFCRDYDPLGAKTPDAPPHKAALRINVNVSLGIAPDAANPNNNVVFTF